MTVLARYTQQTSESKLRDINASRWLRDGETVSSVTPTVTRLSGPDPEVTPLECEATIVGGTLIKVLTYGGDDLSEYKVDLLIVTNLQTREDELYFRIEDI